jgi:hypothetical protein
MEVPQGCNNMHNLINNDNFQNRRCRLRRFHSCKRFCFTIF